MQGSAQGRQPDQVGVREVALPDRQDRGRPGRGRPGRGRLGRGRLVRGRLVLDHQVPADRDPGQPRRPRHLQSALQRWQQQPKRGSHQQLMLLIFLFLPLRPLLAPED